LIEELGLQKSVFLKGVTSEPIEELAKSDICAFPSSFEGFGLSLAEAMSVGLPCVGLKSARGVNELIKDGENGLLVGDGAEEFAKGLEKLMNDVDLRKNLGEKAVDSLAQYEPEVIWNKWESFLRSVVGKQENA
jgi:glycosyltransferase involved in cell wall biosynthesis